MQPNFERVKQEIEEYKDEQQNACPKCENLAGYKTDHEGFGFCYKHDEKKDIAGIYQGSGVFTNVLKEMADKPGEAAFDINTQILIQQSIMQTLMSKADKENADGEVSAGLLSQISHISNAITKNIKVKESIEQARLNKIDMSREIAMKLIAYVETVIKTHVSDEATLQRIGKDFNRLLENVNPVAGKKLLKG